MVLSIGKGYPRSELEHYFSSAKIPQQSDAIKMYVTDSSRGKSESGVVNKNQGAKDYSYEIQEIKEADSKYMKMQI